MKELSSDEALALIAKVNTFTETKRIEANKAPNTPEFLNIIASIEDWSHGSISGVQVTTECSRYLAAVAAVSEPLKEAMEDILTEYELPISPALEDWAAAQSSLWRGSKEHTPLTFTTAATRDHISKLEADLNRIDIILVATQKKTIMDWGDLCKLVVQMRLDASHVIDDIVACEKMFHVEGSVDASAADQVAPIHLSCAGLLCYLLALRPLPGQN